MESLSGPRVFAYARRRKDCVKISSELAQGRRAWSCSVRDVEILMVQDITFVGVGQKYMIILMEEFVERGGGGVEILREV